MTNNIEEVKALAVTELYTICEDCLFRNYSKIERKLVPYTARCYEKGVALYLVFKPFDRNYDASFDAMDHIRKYITEHCTPYLMIITREIIATKVHYNVFMWTSIVYRGFFHERHTSRYMIYCDEMPTYGDRKRVMYYMIKESRERYFNKKRDYIIKEYTDDIAPLRLKPSLFKKA